MKTIWKFPLTIQIGPGRDPNTAIVSMPRGAQVLSVGQQRDVVVWALVEPDAPLVQRRFGLRTTGAEVPGGTFLGTLQFREHPPYPFVWHIFDEGELI